MDEEPPLHSLDFTSLWFTTTTTTTTTMTWPINITTNDSSSSNTNITTNSNADKPGPLITLAVPLLMFCTGLLGNLVALLLLWRSRRENARSVFYRLVAGLALTDLVGTLATSPVTILVYSKDRQWVGGQPMCDYFSFMMIWAGLATVVVVGFMALERYVAILHPYSYERCVNPGRVKVVIAAVWVGAAAFSSLPLLHFGRNVRHYPGTWCFFDFYSNRTVDKVFSFVYASIGILVISATAVCNVAVMVVLLRMRRVSKNMGKSSEGRTLNMTSEMQMIFFLAGIILVFATCYSPLMIRVIINASKTVSDNVEADLMAIRLASLNQILDPWVYLLFRRRLAALLYSACKTVSPLQNMSSLRAFRSEMGNNSPRNSPSLRHHSVPSARSSNPLAAKEGKESGDGSASPVVQNGGCGDTRCAGSGGGCGGGGGEQGRKDGSDTSLVAKDSPVVQNGTCVNGGVGDKTKDQRGDASAVVNGDNLGGEAGKSSNGSGTTLLHYGGVSNGTNPSNVQRRDSQDLDETLKSDCKGQYELKITREAGEAGSDSEYSQLLGRDSGSVTLLCEVTKDDENQNVITNPPCDPTASGNAGEKTVKVSFCNGHTPSLSEHPQTATSDKHNAEDSGSADSRRTRNQTSKDHEPKTETDRKAPQGILRVQNADLEAENYPSKPKTKTDALASNSASWPMICRHGNQIVISVQRDTGSDRLGQSQSLLQGQTETFCDQCKRASKDLAFV